MDVYADLLKWRKKAKRAPNAPFASEHIPAWMAGALRMRLQHDPQHAFDPLVLDAVKADRNLEVETAIAIALLWRRELKDKLTEMLREGRTELPPEYATTIQPLLRNMLATAMADALLRDAAAIDFALAYDAAVPYISRWATGHAGELVDHLATTDQKTLGALGAQVGGGQLTLDEGVTKLSALWSTERAGVIAATEVTAAFHAASELLVATCAMANVDTEMIWQTARNEMVCKVCRPLDGQPESVWRPIAPNGPPQHISCRCKVLVQRRKMGA